ncbi:MAG TPA: nicotinate (nicotinamide) nucleotide adenylyltransferase [Burkholderiaceae bacterium]|nr:nicotinate (nicotinamide) nucleotide adenylyltransferase [Burkholderiaceae bacterium]
MSRPRQGLLGGSFDPVHVAHVELARQALRHLGLDGVTLLPAARPWQRGELGATGPQRLEMLELVTRDEPGLDVSPLEIERGGPTYTIDTLQALPADKDYVWILGADQLENFCTWKQWDDIARKVTLAVAARPGSQLKAPAPLQTLLDSLGRSLQIIPMPAMDVSATAIRERLAAGRAVDTMLHPRVAQYIQRHGLYRHPAA